MRLPWGTHSADPGLPPGSRGVQIPCPPRNQESHKAGVFGCPHETLDLGYMDMIELKQGGSPGWCYARLRLGL